MIKQLLVIGTIISMYGLSEARSEPSFTFAISFSLTKCTIDFGAPPSCSEAPGGLSKVQFSLLFSQCSALPNGTTLCQGLSQHTLQMDGYTFFANILITETIDRAGKVSASGNLSTGKLDANGAHLNSTNASVQFKHDSPSDEIGISSDWFYPSNPSKVTYSSGLTFGPP
jgi:hypothetical protein